MDALSDGDVELLVGIRHFELALLRVFGEGKVNGTTHTCLGQEYVPVALAPLLDGDFVLSNHRGHGHYLAHFRDPAGMLAEIMGRAGAVCSGVGGSQHVHRDGFLSTGVQGQSLPLAVGMGLHYKRTGANRVAAAYIGDGTWGEGAVYEALNMAALWRVPVLVVVEHNGIAQSTPTTAQLAGTIGDRVRAFGLDFTEITTHDIPAIRAELAPVVDRVRHEHRPAVVQFTTRRLGPHSKGDDTRSAQEVEALRAADWYAELATALGPRFTAVDERVRTEVDRLVAEVEARPPSTWADLAEAGAVR
ncbi:thiamine pyrophosphate-dependent dehydrogenase E1 component subunit alpha [Umezawaea sp.]|uniref:thiamine pyrophosphate-dependent dehydrogenase E1 component subunit alpha n=1 Tax=Umezawaea sp. TaxID=1955258 RepID=UPI002ED5979D